MTKTFLIVFCLLMSVGGFAQKTKTINNPYYEFKKTGLTNISRIELSKKETRVYIHNTFLPNWWVMFNKDDALIDSHTQKRYEVKSIEGARFNKKLWMPASGDSTIVLVFPPLDKNTKAVDFNDKIFGISLDEGLAGMKPNHTVPFEMEQWMSTELAKCTYQPLSNYDGEDFFTKGNGRVVGYIKGYSSKSGVKTGILYLSNYLTREDYPIVIEIEEDGRFDVTLPLIAPLYTSAQIGNKSIRFYLEPNQTLGMIIDWEEVLLADRLRDRRYKFQHIAYKGKLAKVNYDLMRYNFERELNFNVTNFKRKKKLSQDEKVAEISKEKLIELNKLDYYSSIWKWSDKANEIITNKILLQHATDMFDIDRDRQSKARRDTANKELKKPLPDSFYDFLKEVPFSKQSLCVNEEFKIFINRFEYSNLIQEHKKRVDAKTSESAKVRPNPMIDFFKLDTYMWRLADDELKERYHINYNLPLEIVKTRTLKYKFERASKKEASEIWDEIKHTLVHKELISTGDELYDKYYGDKVAYSYALPESKATDVFNKIIEPHKGKVLFVDFWATFCGPCISSIKRMKEVREQYTDDKDVDFVFITDERGSPKKKYDEFVMEQELKNTYRISADDYLYLRQLFKFNGIPRYVVIGKDGKVIDDNFSMYQFKTKVDDIVAKENNLLTEQ